MLDEALTELEALLNQERDAIRLLDGARVAEFARRKQSLVARLNASRNDFRPVDAARLKALTPALRQNGVLLAHARDITRDALAAMRLASPGTTYDASRSIQGAPRMLSVRG